MAALLDLAVHMPFHACVIYGILNLNMYVVEPQN